MGAALAQVSTEAMGFFGTDGAEKKGVQNLQNQPTLNGGGSIEGQAASLARMGNSVDDLSFKERSVRDISDRGRAKTVEDIMRALATAFKSERERKKTEQINAAAVAAAAGQAVPQSATQQAVCAQLDILRRIRAKGKAPNPYVAAAPLQTLAALPINSEILKRTKVALELNHDFWRKTAPEDVRRMVNTLVREWKAAYRKEEDGPSERTLRNSAAEIEESAQNVAPRKKEYSALVDGLLRKFLTSPEVGTSILDGCERAQELVSRINRRVVAEVANAGMKQGQASGSGSQAALPPPEKRLRLTDGFVELPFVDMR